MFAGLKSSMLSILKIDNNNNKNEIKPNNKNNNNNNKSIIDKKTVAITTVLLLLTSIAIKCGEEDVSLVLGIVGSVIG